MILQPSNVKLTKVHYYEKNIAGQKIPTISQEVDEKEKSNYERNVIIKKNIFGHKWVLKVNDNNDDNVGKKKSRIKVVLYLMVFLSITIAVGFGIFFSLNNTIFRKKEKYVNDFVYIGDTSIRSRPHPESPNSTDIPPEEVTNYTTTDNDIDEKNLAVTERKPYCTNCESIDTICMQLNETSRPECVPVLDLLDPTGCGGLCSINTEYCQVLSQTYQVYQCLPRKSILICDEGQFSCENMCIDEIRRCDGTIDCSNQLDEQNCLCDLTTHFHCGNNTSCLDLVLKCNQIGDCWDNSDEENCLYTNECSFEGQFRCTDGQCIDQNDFCNGIFDCRDKSDEPYGCIDY